MKRLNHHIRLSLALGIEFRRDDHLQSVSFLIANLILNLPGLLATALAGLLLRLSGLPVAWAAERRRWAEEWPVIVEAGRLLLVGRWVFLEGVV